MTECTTCGSYLSSDYVRVCGDNENEVDTCIHCAARHREEDRLSATSGRETSKQDDGTDTSKLVLPLTTTDDTSRQDQKTTFGGAEQPHDDHDTEEPHTDRNTRRPRIGQNAERPRTLLSAVMSALR